MIDFNALFSQALTAAVAEATKPLAARVDELEARVTDVVGQLARALLAAETGHAAASQGALEARLAALEARPAVQVDEAKMVEALNGQEWFWEKVRGFADAAAEAVMEDHTSSYDHDDYDALHNEWGSEEASDFVKDGDLDDQIQEKVNDVLNNATLSIRL